MLRLVVLLDPGFLHAQEHGGRVGQYAHPLDYPDRFYTLATARARSYMAFP